jgi:hypothetical protein
MYVIWLDNVGEAVSSGASRENRSSISALVWHPARLKFRASGTLQVKDNVRPNQRSSAFTFSAG